MCRTSCTTFAKLTGAGPDRPLIGTVALFRMGKRVIPVVEHHFCQHGAPRCGHGRGPAEFRALCRARTAAPRSPAVSPGTGLVGPTQLAGPGPMAVLLQCV